MAELIDPTTDASAAARQVPAPRTALVGRERELGALIARLRDPMTPIVTITGPGGVGKTRLAHHAAWEMRDAYPDGVVQVALADVERPEWLVRRIAHALALRSFDAQLSEATLIDELRDRSMLLVLDNLEQIDEAGQLVARIAETATGITMVITSRVPMRVRGEVEFPLAPLTLPKSDLFHPPSVDELRRSAAVSLFQERAQAVNPSFDVTAENAADIVRICERLDGLPLALELAAARMKLLSPAALAARLDNRLRILGGGARDLPDRQQNLRQTIAWSYDLLDANERTIFRALSVFADGFGIDAAAAVLGIEPDDPDLLDWLGSLVDQSLLQRASEQGDETRLAMLETIREFGLEQLRAYGEEEPIRAAHAAYYRRYAEESVGVVDKRMAGAMAERLQRELANIHQALDWFIERSDADGTVSLVLAMSKFWIQRGYLVEGSRLIERAVELIDRVAPITQARILRFSAWFICMRGGLDDALERITRALAMARSEHDPAFLAETLNAYGGIRIYRREIEAAKAAWEEALTIAEPHSRTHVSVLNNLGVVALLEHDLDRAERLFLESAEAMPPDERSARRDHQIGNLAEIAMLRGDLATARQLMNQAIERIHLNDIEGMLGGARGAAGLVFLEGDARRAALILGWVIHIGRRLGMSESVWDFHSRETYERLGETLGADAFESLLQEGALLSVEAVIDLAREPGDADATTQPKRVTGAASDERVPDQERADSVLTAREIDVARLVAQGKSNREIAADLFISARTAQTHVTNMLSKLGLDSRAALAAYVVRHDLA